MLINELSTTSNPALLLLVFSMCSFLFANHVAGVETPSPNVSDKFSAQTLNLLKLVEGNASKAQMDAFKQLPTRPEWQKVLDLMIKKIKADPKGGHNNHCLAIHFILEKHLQIAVIDVDPLIGLLSTTIWTNQQKASQVLAVAAKNPSLLEGKEKRACRALIPLTGSQRSRVLNGAIGALRRLGGPKDIGRDPEKWAKWFQEKYKEKITLAGSVFEIIAVIRYKPGVDKKVTYSLNGHEVGDNKELKKALVEFKKKAKALKLQAGVVLVVANELMLSRDVKMIKETAAPVLSILVSIGLHTWVVAPEADAFYAPYENGFPKGE